MPIGESVLDSFTWAATQTVASTRSSSATSPTRPLCRCTNVRLRHDGSGLLQPQTTDRAFTALPDNQRLDDLFSSSPSSNETTDLRSFARNCEVR